MWLSEIMLQQTTVAAVTPRFERFMSRWPTVETLAAAADDEILSEWAGLGYYARARNLIAAAREIARRGGFPTSSAELRELPGIGGYTSAAVAAIAFGERVAAVDTNVARVVARLYGLKHPTRTDTHRLTLGLTPSERPGDFIQAMMDLGATVCRPKMPACEKCPLAADCAAQASGSPQAFPDPPQRRIRPHKFGVAYWIVRDAHVWLMRRPAKGVLGGMAALPGSDWTDAKPDVRRTLAVVRHVFTHFSLDLVIEARPEPVGEGWWHRLDCLSDVGLPTLYRKAVDAIVTPEERIAA